MLSSLSAISSLNFCEDWESLSVLRGVRSTASQTQKHLGLLSSLELHSTNVGLFAVILLPSPRSTSGDQFFF